jgi:NarL family two-component system response regulator YdfI
LVEEQIRVLIADDHLIVREGVRLILETVDGIELVGEATDGAEAIDLIESLDPDVVLMDLRMPGVDGLTAIKRLQQSNAQTAIVILTTYNEDDLILRGLQAGARGYLLKDTDRQTLIDSIRAAARGETLLTSEIIGRLLSRTEPPSKQAAPAPASALDLTERELEVLSAVARGERNKEIAVGLGITERTVKAHLTNIYNKLGVDCRAAAIATAARIGLLSA